MTKSLTDNILPLRIADAHRGIRHVFVRDLDLEVEIGVHAHEKGRAQRIRVNVDLSVIDPPSGIPDRLDAVVCYETLVDNIRHIAAEGHIHLVETLAEKIAEAALADHRVVTARVRVEKPDAIANAASVGVEIERPQAEAPASSR